MDSFLKRHWFLVGMVAAVSCGSLLPEGGQALRSSGYVIPLLVAVVLAISGFTLDTSRLLVQ
ncbi:MAG: bile acid:sodium symporter, partial [Planctomycetes bacterium]|nr:bile acid:sodium symporter [Planctomycetota bacterium]